MAAVASGAAKGLGVQLVMSAVDEDVVGAVRDVHSRRGARVAGTGRSDTAADRRSMTPAETTRCILDSLAAAYARTVHHAAELAHVAVDVIHVVGGGSQNALLGQLTADAAGLPVLAGPVEATALGNVLVQARTHGAVPPSLEAIRARLAASTPLRRYDPS